MKSSRFHIIDLAGSERSKQTNAVGERLKEGAMINKSLSTLGNVIKSLVELSQGKVSFVNYRDSKLTFLLRDSLGGNSRTMIIANVTAATISRDETLSTLKFARRAKMIKNKAKINEESSSTISLLKQQLMQSQKDRLALQDELRKASVQLKKITKQQIINAATISNNENEPCQKCIKMENATTADFEDSSFVVINQNPTTPHLPKT